MSQRYVLIVHAEPSLAKLYFTGREDHAGAFATHVNFLQPFCLHNARGHKGGRDEKERRRGGNDWWTISHRRIN